MRIKMGISYKGLLARRGSRTVQAEIKLLQMKLKYFKSFLVTLNCQYKCFETKLK